MIHFGNEGSLRRWRCSTVLPQWVVVKLKAHVGDLGLNGCQAFWLMFRQFGLRFGGGVSAIREDGPSGSSGSLSYRHANHTLFRDVYAAPRIGCGHAEGELSQRGHSQLGGEPGVEYPARSLVPGKFP